MSFTFKRNRCVLSLCLAAVSPAFAQDVRVETQQQARTRYQQTFEEQAAPEEVSDPELGEINLVLRAPRPKMFTLSTLQTLNYSSNAFLTRDDTQGDFFWNGGLGASFVPFATRNFTPRLRFDQNWFRYSEFSILDFDSQSLQLDLKYDLNRDDTWFVNGSYALGRFTAPHGSTGEFYRYGFLNASVTHLFQLQTAPVGFSLSGGAYWRHGDPSSNDRVSGYLSMAAIYNITQTFQLQGFARPEVQHYTHDLSGSSREDFNLTLGAVLSWTPKECLTLAATASYVGNFSTESMRRYDLVTPSLVFAAQIAF